MNLKDFFGSQYKSQKFEEFLTEHFYGFAVSDNVYDDVYLSESEKEHIQDYRYLGQAELDEGKEIGFFEFRSTSRHIENKRVGYNATLRKLAKDHILDGAIASFYYSDGDENDAWRLSFVGIDYDAGKANVTNLKRYTYVLGKNVPIQTPLEQLKDLKYPNMLEIEKAFSVERVSNEFFEKYKNLYLELSDYLQSQIAYFGNEKNLNLFTKKLLGRVVFLYFIQKKGWFGSKEEWGTGNKRFLSDCFFEKCDYENFYFEILQPIFFEALNEDRRDNDDYFELLDCKMPFLNGGLFSRDAFDKKDIIIENSIFRNIFTTFDQYNFTIIEDNPNDSEIAIDPEMLGRVFESLLEDRKEKGAFYTPREIVHYMSRNAIEHYLKTEAKEYNYVFSVDEFLHKTSLDDEGILQFHTEHPVKFIKLDNYFEALLPYQNLIIDFYMVVKVRGLLLNKDGSRVKGKKGHPEITVSIWQKILKKEYKVVAINFGTNKEVKLSKNYKYPTILKYIQIEEKFFALAFLPNIWGDLELNTIFPIREKNIKSRLKKFDKPLQEITKNNFVFDNDVYEKVEALREDCRSLHAEPLHQGAELPRQAVVQKGLSTFRNTFTLSSLADSDLKSLLKDKDYYDKTINKLLNASTLTQHKLKDIMLKKLKQIKILDPAIGSGAFPMGVLHELVDLRRHLGDTTDLAKLKKEIIENSIYGIDIEPSAVEIAKLRFWLSIVVDEDIPTPLPNLFYKIMVGNSLLETINGYDPLVQKKKITNIKQVRQEKNQTADDRIFLMQEKFHKYFNTTDNKEKEKLDTEIKRNINLILQSSLKSFDTNKSLLEMTKKEQKIYEENFEITRLLKKILDNYQEYNATNELFFYKVYFAEVMNAGGFNVIIGNPPYIKEYTNKSAFERMNSLECYQGKMDLWYLFACKGIDLLQDSGILSYIATNNWISNAGASKFRNKVLKETQIKEFIDFGDYKVFDTAGIQTMIMFLHKIKDNAKYSCDYSKVLDKSLAKSELINILEKQINPKFSIFKSIVESDKLMNKSITFLESSISFILDKIENNRNFILEDKEVAQGIVGAPDKAFIVQEEDYNSFNDEEKKYLKNFHTNCGKFITQRSSKYIFYMHYNNFEDKSISDFVNIEKHFVPFKDELKKAKIKYKTPSKAYYYLHRERDEKFFLKGSKIICATRTARSSCTYTEDEFYGSRALNFIKTDRISLKYLTCILNSKLANFWLKYKGKLTGDLLQIDKSQLLNIPNSMF